MKQFITYNKRALEFIKYKKTILEGNNNDNATTGFIRACLKSEWGQLRFDFSSKAIFLKLISFFDLGKKIYLEQHIQAINNFSIENYLIISDNNTRYCANRFVNFMLYLFNDNKKFMNDEILNAFVEKTAPYIVKKEFIELLKIDSNYNYDITQKYLKKLNNCKSPKKIITNLKFELKDVEKYNEHKQKMNKFFIKLHKLVHHLNSIGNNIVDTLAKEDKLILSLKIKDYKSAHQIILKRDWSYYNMIEIPKNKDDMDSLNFIPGILKYLVLFENINSLNVPDDTYILLLKTLKQQKIDLNFIFSENYENVLSANDDNIKYLLKRIGTLNNKINLNEKLHATLISDHDIKEKIRIKKI